MSSQFVNFCIVSCTLLGFCAAFGAGNIPSYGQLEGIAFRHGDIEDILLQMAMVPAAAGASGFLSSLNPLSNAGKRFNAMAVKRVYFGNFLRDYSQAIDVGTLSKGLDVKTIRLLVWVMSFMAMGYATEEFEVTEARLGVYRPEEHIDNPKGYPNPEEPDARKFDSRLRGPVQAVELEIDPATGMKNYIANERGDWMTSSAYVRNSLVRCIELGREYKNTGNSAAKYESLRVMGQACHTLEDFPAHSNYVELTLIELGNRDVFPHVGLRSHINLNGRNVFPLTTGTFGGLDFVHSLLGEATDKISQTQISEVSSGLASSSAQGSSGLLSTLQSLVSNIPGGSTFQRDFENMQSVSQEADRLRNSMMNRDAYQDRSTFSTASIDVDADEIARKIYPVMAFRDRLMKGLSAFFEKIPGLSALIDNISETLTVFVLSTIEPFMKPIVEKVTAGLGAGQALVTSKDDQLAVFEDPHATDPTHSMLAKDHFSCYLNNPAGLCGQAIVKHVVTRVTAAWADPSLNPLQLVDEILEVLHHPAAMHGRTSIQSEMKDIVQRWAANLGSKRSRIMQGLTFDGVKQGLHHEGGSATTTGVSAIHSHAPSHPSTSLGLSTQSAAVSHELYTTHDTGPFRNSDFATKPYNSESHISHQNTRPGSGHQSSSHHQNHDFSRPLTEAHDTNHMPQGQSSTYYTGSATSPPERVNLHSTYSSGTSEASRPAAHSSVRPHDRPSPDLSTKYDIHASVPQSVHEPANVSDHDRPQTAYGFSNSPFAQENQTQGANYPQHMQYGNPPTQTGPIYSQQMYGYPPPPPPQDFQQNYQQTAFQQGPPQMIYGDSGDWTRPQPSFQQQFDQYGNPIPPNYNNGYR